MFTASVVSADIMHLPLGLEDLSTIWNSEVSVFGRVPIKGDYQRFNQGCI